MRLIQILFFGALVVALAGFFYFHPFLRNTTITDEQLVRFSKEIDLERGYSRSRQLAAATGLLQRVVGSRANGFVLEIFTNSGFSSKGDLLPLARKPDIFELESKFEDVVGTKGETVHKVCIRGNTGVAIASGLHWYLKYYCNVQYTWETEKLELPEYLPEIPKKVRRESLVPFSYYENVCTHSYSQAWWTWERWEREIDWMAMHGINMPLASTGQEFVLQKTFSKFDISPQQMQDYFTGPGFLAWNRMGNIKKFATPLPPKFIKDQYQLQLKILERERSLGMTPVLPSFAGFVPDAMREMYPGVSFRRSQPWSGFQGEECCVSMLEPNTELFQKIGRQFMKEVNAAYGTDHFYSCDTFNENRPSSRNADYISASSNAVYSAMVSEDAKAVWVMQGWLFVNDHDFWDETNMRALLDGVPSNRMLILDLHADVYAIWKRSEGFQGRPFVWCLLHNFGGQTGLYGILPEYNKQIFQAKRAYGNMMGVGLTMEGIEQNELVYAFVTEMRFNTESVNETEWVENYIRSRYNLKKSVEDPFLSAWVAIAKSVYHVRTRQMGASKSLIERRPNLDLHVRISGDIFQPRFPGYDPAVLFSAWKTIVLSGMSLRKSETFLYDLVDLTRQVLSDYFLLVYGQLMSAYYDNNTQKMDECIRKLNSIIMDMDAVLHTNKKFLLGAWIESARAWGENEPLRWHFEWNARNQVTRWGSNGEINDYASKLWGGLVGTYYKQRWHIFFELLKKSAGKKFDYEKLGAELESFERNWLLDKKLEIPSEPFGDTISVVGLIHKRIADDAQELHSMRPLHS